MGQYPLPMASSLGSPDLYIGCRVGHIVVTICRFSDPIELRDGPFGDLHQSRCTALLILYCRIETAFFTNMANDQAISNIPRLIVVCNQFFYLVKSQRWHVFLQSMRLFAMWG